MKLDEPTLVHTGGSAFGAALIYMGLRTGLLGYLIPGILWFATNVIFLRYGESFFDPIFPSSSPLFPVLFMAIPAFVMGLIVFCTTYNYNDQIIRYLVLAVILVDCFHLCQADWRIFAGIVAGLLAIRAFNPVHYDDLHPGLDTHWDYVKRSDILYVVPKYYGDPLTNHPDYIARLKKLAAGGKELAMHGVEHRPEGFFIEAEFGKPLPRSYIESGIRTFTKAFGAPPARFKAPCYNLHPKNRAVLEEHGIRVDGPETLLFNKLYHFDGSAALWVFNKLAALV
jgi:Uncharacterized protein conserved in bacteria (DUF2334)